MSDKMIFLPEHCVEWAAELADVELRTGYSGRFMYGAQCLAVVGDASAASMFLMKLRTELAEDDADPNDDHDAFIEQMARAQRQDQMGLSMVFYWPGYGVEGVTSPEPTR